ncbi:MAG: NAD(P)/FAD-dependent oxidoreductase [Candidatus Fimenecus sp.]
MSTIERQKEKILIIGAGPAGLTAGLELLRTAPEKYSVTVLEKSDTVGGISKTVNVNGNRMDMGGHRFFSKSDRVNAFWESLCPLQGEQPSERENEMLLRKRVSRIFYGGKFFDYPITLKPQTFQNLGLVRTVSAGCGYLAAVCRKKEETSLENFYINRFGKPLYQMFFEDYTEKLWGRHPSEISADWGAQRVKGVSVKEVLKNALGGKKSQETSLIEQFKYPKHGPGQLWGTAAAEFQSRGGELRFSARVCGVQTENGRVTAVTAEGNGEKKVYACDALLSSMPLCDLIAAFPENSVPQGIQETAAGLPYRDFVTVGLLVRKQDLDCTSSDGALLPDCWIYVQERTVRLGRVQIFNNWSPYMVKDGAHTVFIGAEYFCREGDELWSRTDKDWAEAAKQDLQTIGLLSVQAELLDAHCERVQKAYPAYFDTYSDLPKVIEFLNGFPNLYCIGRNGQHRYNNMDHSMLTAFEAVRCISENDTDKTALWAVNSEEEYHETKEGGS